MPSWATEFLTGGIGQGLMAPWNLCMLVTAQLLGFDVGSSFYVVRAGNSIASIYTWFVGAGAALLNMFCLIAFCRQASRLRENVTIEMWIELFIKVILGNGFMLYGIKVLSAFLSVAGQIGSIWLAQSENTIVSDNVDVGAVLVYIFFGILFTLASIICGVMIVVTVAKRIIHIYLLTVTMPIACATLAGGRGIEDSGWSWLKSFLAECFEVVIIALVFVICGMLHDTINNLLITAGEATELGWFDGFLTVLFDTVYMILLTILVKNAGDFLKRAFNLK